MKSDMKTWCLITTRPLSWQRSLKISTLIMYRVNKIHMQTHWHLSLLLWPFQLELHREYLSTVVTCTVANSFLKTVELQEETFKLKRFLRLWKVSNLEIGDSLTLTLSYRVYCPTTPKRQLPSEGKLLDSITMRSCRHYITHRMMESCFNAFHTKSHRWHLKKFMMVCD